MKQYNIGIVGVGTVGTEMVRLLKKRRFPVNQLIIFARTERHIEIDQESFHVRVATPEEFEDIDFAFFAGTEGAKGASQTLGWEAVQRDCVVIDNGDDFRMDPRVPLVIPEINPESLHDHQGFFANPNCSAIIALMALAPLHRAAGIQRFIACTYQAVSGSGSSAVKELKAQIKDWAQGDDARPSVYPHPIAFNVLAQIGGVKDEPGVTSEELKMKRETHKILGDDSIQISTTCVRVPVFNGHSEAIHVEFENELSVEEARKVLDEAPGVQVIDDIDNNQYPTSLDCCGKEDVLVGRLRKDESVEHGLALFVSGDNLWKGAALNAIQIAEKLIEIRAR
ncbi:MAG: aspartate-semialdehyde dehydrogenase [Kiritimatiellae bacterium]|nr:aspartate-semialdehyde dehydrogenase [Kiritimatiellia bacterium]